jgi:hypothetical protein
MSLSPKLALSHLTAGAVLPVLSTIIYLMKVSGNGLCTAGR